ncbi:MAG TPA: sugar ABC transporter permease, partial [Amaricoccus sp.]|nr:sugar ABC transporter permease [Amaricoccus sp.]
MPHRTFFKFIAPSLFVMLLFIALPILSVAYQSLFIEHEQILVEVENCGPFGCEKELRIDTEAMDRAMEESPMGRFNWLGTYANTSHLAFAEVGAIWRDSDGPVSALRAMLNLPFYKALIFTIAYTFIVTPL